MTRGHAEGVLWPVDRCHVTLALACLLLLAWQGKTARRLARVREKYRTLTLAINEDWALPLAAPAPPRAPWMRWRLVVMAAAVALYVAVLLYAVRTIHSRNAACAARGGVMEAAACRVPVPPPPRP